MNRRQLLFLSSGSPLTFNFSHTPVDEDEPIGTVVGTFGANKMAVTYTLVSDPDNKFEIVGDELRTTELLDYETDSSHDITVEALDTASGQSLSKVFTINVANIVETYPVNAVNFDGTTDHLTRAANLTGLSDGKAGVFSGWVRIGGGAGMGRTIFATTALRFFLMVDTSNRIDLKGSNAAGTSIFRRTTSATYAVGATWRHILASWDLATSTGLLYVNDAAPGLAASTTTNDSIDYTDTDFGIGARPLGAAYADKFNGDMAELFFHNTFLDISVTANRRKFIDAAGKPVDLGVDGSTPLGVQPIVFLSGATASWHTNKGTGGGMSVTGGALSDAATRPSD